MHHGLIVLVQRQSIRFWNLVGKCRGYAMVDWAVDLFSRGTLGECIVGVVAAAVAAFSQGRSTMGGVGTLHGPYCVGSKWSSGSSGWTAAAAGLD